jgi:hypothetical protein
MTVVIGPNTGLHCREHRDTRTHEPAGRCASGDLRIPAPQRHIAPLRRDAGGCARKATCRL